MENDELLRRAEDLSARCEKNCEITSSFFLTPAQQMLLQKWSAYGTDCQFLLHGGGGECERKAAFFLPYYMDAGDFDAEEYISCIRLKAGFGEPGHRDYLGAALGLGIRREWLGDIWIKGQTAYIFCLPGVEKHLLFSLDKVGRYGVKAEKVLLSAAEAPERHVKKVSFTVKNPRLDAVAAGMFNLSRTECAKLIETGLASLNYEECLRCDARIKEGDIISLRGFGKGSVAAYGGVSKKGRQFMEAEVWK